MGGLRGQTGGRERERGADRGYGGGCRGGARAAYSGASLLHASGNGVSQVWGKQRPPPVSQSRGRAVRDERPSRPGKAGGGRRGEARPPQLPRGQGSLPETPSSPAPDVVTAAAARQSHPRNSAARPSLPPQVGAVDSGGAPQPQDPGTGSGSSAAQGRTPTPAAAMMD